MKFKTLKQLSEKSLVSDLKLKTKVICLCLLAPPVAIELYNMFFLENKLVFPILEVGVVIWAIICGVYLLLMMFSISLQKFSIKDGTDFHSIRQNIMFLVGLFILVSVVFSVLFVIEFKQRSSWQESIKEAQELMIQLEQEKD